MRIAAAAMLARLQTAHSNVELAVSQATGRATESLSKLAANLASSEQALAQSLQSGGQLANLDLNALDRLIQTSESNAQAAVAAGAAETAAVAAQAFAATDAATRAEAQSVAADLYTKKMFDPYLHFGSDADREQYERDSQERQRQIALELAKHTPEGNLNAGGLEEGQMLEAAAHGATASPAFMPEWNKLVARNHEQREAMVARGQPTAQFDAQTREGIRSFLQHENIPADQIARVLAAQDPMQAVTPYLSQKSERELEASLRQPTAIALSAQPSPASGSATPQAVGLSGAAGALGGVSIAGISFDAGAPIASEPEHGLPSQVRSPVQTPGLGHAGGRAAG